MITLITMDRFQEFLLSICKSDTSSDPDRWTPENFLWGHSAVVSLMAQDVFGGELVMIPLKGTEFAALCFHYWNELSDTWQADFTRDQFQGRFPRDVSSMRCNREGLLRSQFTPTFYGTLVIDDTAKRYELLRGRLADELRSES